MPEVLYNCAPNVYIGPNCTSKVGNDLKPLRLCYFTMHTLWADLLVIILQCSVGCFLKRDVEYDSDMKILRTLSLDDLTIKNEPLHSTTKRWFLNPVL